MKYYKYFNISEGQLVEIKNKIRFEEMGQAKLFFCL